MAESGLYTLVCRLRCFRIVKRIKRELAKIGVRMSMLAIVELAIDGLYEKHKKRMERVNRK